MSNFLPAIIEAYEPASRLYRISIPGKTDGSQVLPQAEAMMSLGDQSTETECRIKLKSPVWVQAINGDPRYFLIVGYRQLGAGNVIGLRYWEQDKFKIKADTRIDLEAGSEIKLKVGATTMTMTASSIIFDTPQGTFTQKLDVMGLFSYLAGLAGSGGAGGASAQIQGGIVNTGGTISSNGVVLDSHRHGGVQTGGGTTGTPV